MISSYILNSVGGAVQGKKWATVQPGDLLERWLGNSASIEKQRERIRRANERHLARLRRERIGDVVI